MLFRSDAAPLFQSRPSDVKTPAELLDPTLTAAEVPPQPEPAPAPVKELLTEKQRKQAVRAEVETATAEVSEAIEKELGTPAKVVRCLPLPTHG